MFESERFQSRHIGPDATERDAMLRTIGAESLDDLVDQAIPRAIRLDRPLDLPPGIGEHQFLEELRQIAARNQVFKSFIGLGYYDCITPSVILRNLFENPSWYTPYTPYQAEIAQGRLEALLNFQTMVRDLTGMEIATASLLDEATAAASQEFLDLVAKSRGAIQKCYTLALKKRSDLQARTITLTVSATFAQSGAYHDASFSPSLGDVFDSCMKTLAAKWALPANSPAMTFRAPVSLTPS